MGCGVAVCLFSSILLLLTLNIYVLKCNRLIIFIKTIKINGNLIADLSFLYIFVLKD